MRWAPERWYATRWALWAKAARHSSDCRTCHCLLGQSAPSRRYVPLQATVAMHALLVLPPPPPLPRQIPSPSPRNFCTGYCPATRKQPPIHTVPLAVLAPKHGEIDIPPSIGHATTLTSYRNMARGSPGRYVRFVHVRQTIVGPCASVSRDILARRARYSPFLVSPTNLPLPRTLLIAIACMVASRHD